MNWDEFEAWTKFFTAALHIRDSMEASKCADKALNLWKEKRDTVVRQKPPPTGL